jgi:RND superfamily putative drug exporter
MRKGFFYRLGNFIYRFRWALIVLWVALFLGSISLGPRLTEPFKAIGFTDPNSPSAKANAILNTKLEFGYNRFIILYRSDNIVFTRAQFSKEIKDSLAGLKNFPIKHQIIYPDDNNKQISADKHSAYAVVLIKSEQEVDDGDLKKFRDSISKPPNLEMHIGGEPIFLEDTKTQTQLDLYKAEYIATPVAVITMLIVFGSVVAASLPVILGGVCALVILLVLFCLGEVFTLSVFTLNIALLLGLCLSLDYALLIINRFRIELKEGKSTLEAIAITQSTAGKSVFFSGLAVFVSLSALLLFKINVLFSVGLGGLAAVSVAVAVAIILLPAILAVLGHRINSLSVKFFKSKKERGHSIWFKIATCVVKNPWKFLITILLLLLSLGYPFVDAKFGFSDFRILPPRMESRQVFENFKKEFGESRLSPILVLVTTSEPKILTQKNIGELYDYAKMLKLDPSVDSILGIVSTHPQLSKKEYQELFTEQQGYWTQQLRDFLDNTTRDNLSVLTVFSKYPGGSTQTTDLIKKIRESHAGPGLSVEVAGTSVNSYDALHSIAHTFPYAFLWIIFFTYLVLLVLLRSVFLPLKAILTATLSLFASYGVLTLVIQQGYLHGVLDFEPQGMLDISLLIIIFCALFGISMDYEVFLLTRIKEYYEKTGKTVDSIVLGIDRSCNVITSAAVVVMFICFSFMSADILIVKAFGLGIAVAVFVDAFIIRLLLVPATMALMGKWNWYLPKWLNMILPKIPFNPD